MSFVKEYVESLDFETKKSILESYDKYKKDGFIGDEPIRIHAIKMSKDAGIPDHDNITVWMEHLAYQCARDFASKYIIENSFTMKHVV